MNTQYVKCIICEKEHCICDAEYEDFLYEAGKEVREDIDLVVIHNYDN